MTGGLKESKKEAFEFELEEKGKQGLEDASFEYEKCGLGCFAPEWIQRFATKKYFVLVFSLLGVIQGMGWAYFTATISTLEKRFKISTQTAGIVMTGNEVSQIVFSIFLSYYGAAGHRPRWIAGGVFLSGIACFILASPHAFYGSGRDALEMTQEYSWMHGLNTAEILTMATHEPTVQPIGQFFQTDSERKPVKGETQDSPSVRPVANNVNLCRRSEAKSAETCVENDANFASLVLIFFSQFISGIGVVVFFTLGGPFMDDNTKRKNIAMLFGITMSLRLIGPTFGFLLASGTLKLYINPLLHPTITPENPRWIGAWWMGWVLLGSAMVLFSTLIAMFPRKLRRDNNSESKADLTDDAKLDTPPKFSEIPNAVKLLMKNKVNVLNGLAATFYLFAGIGYWTYMPKYMETIFMQTASNSSIISGLTGILTQSAGLLLSGFLISRYQFSARKLAFWNVVTGILSVCVMLALTQLGCDIGKLSFGEQDSEGRWNLTTSCNVDCNCKTSKILPVCYEKENTVFYSACHAGCETFENSDKISNCSCLPDPSESVSLGNCSTGCGQIFMIFLIISAVIKFVDATGRIGNMLVSYRCVKQEERSLSIGIQILVLSAFALLPAPIVFGRIIDSVCIVWGGAECGRQGNCLLYDGHQLRYVFNVVAAGFMLVGVFFDSFVCYFVKNLDLYKE